MQKTQFFASLLSLVVVLGTMPAHASKVVNDSLVKNLRCDFLTVENIYQAIRDDAFAEGRNMPIENWEFRSRVGELGSCWGLSRAQRMMFYLGRYYSEQPDAFEKIESIMDQIRGRRLVPNRMRAQHYPISEPYFEYPLLKQHVFHVREGSLNETTKVPQGLWPALLKGYMQELGWNHEERTFRGDIQASQVRAFLRFSNISMGMGNGPLSELANANTVAQLIRNLNSKKLTLVNLRADQYAQHIVVFKSYRVLDSGTIEFKVYDSNQPQKDQVVYFEGRRQHFFAPDIFKLIIKKKANYALGAFIVDEDERDDLEKTLLEYYKERCR